MQEPHKSLSGFLADLHEQCDLYAGSTSKDPFVKLVIDHVKLMLVSAGYVVLTDSKNRIFKTGDK